MTDHNRGGKQTMTGFVWSERYAWHDTGHGAGPFPAGGWLQPAGHVEAPETKRRLRNLLDVSGLLEVVEHLAPRPASDAQLERFHDPEYLARLRELSAAGGGDAGNLTPFGPGGYDIAVLSAGGAVVAVDAVLDARVANAYALVRPPGHHALPDTGMGFCLLGNIAIAALHARHERGVARVAVVDWDVHHGNGTQAAFYADPTVLTISLHQDSFFPPGSGTVLERGEGEGFGRNVNVPLPSGSGEGAYLHALDEVVLPALDEFEPELILVACGFDASAFDPLGRQLLHSASFAAMTDRMLEAADRLCDGRLVLVHEGGYSDFYVPFCGLAVMERLTGHDTPVEDPYLQLLVDLPDGTLKPHQSEAVSRAVHRATA